MKYQSIRMFNDIRFPYMGNCKCMICVSGNGCDLTFPTIEMRKAKIKGVNIFEMSIYLAAF